MRLNLFVSAFIGAASVLAAAEAMAQCTTKSIPLPAAALLTPPSASSCAFQIVSLNAAPSQLDYELQCHRDAGVILRERLLKLQASVGETVKAINRACPDAVSTARPGSRPSIPLPRRTLLTPPPDVDCTFKDNDAAESAPSPTPAQAIAAVRIKLDYERQCYRHNEIILLNGLGELQAAVGETVKAVIVLEQGHQPTEDLRADLKSYSREHLASYKTPAYIAFLGEELPRNPMGKVLKTDLRRDHGGPDDN